MIIKIQTRIKYLILCVMLLVSCKKETDTRQIVSFTDLSTKYNIQGLYAFDYNREDKVFVLGYSNRYEIRDENFTILKQGTLTESPYSILYTKDSVFFGHDVSYYLTSSGKVISANPSIKLYDPASKNWTFLYGAQGVNSFVETDKYYVFSTFDHATCVFIEKSTNIATTFIDYFVTNNIDGGSGVAKDQQGDIILSTSDNRHLVYSNGVWIPFQPTKFDGSQGKIAFVDSRNYLWINTYNNDAFVILDMNKGQYLNTNPANLGGNYFGYTLSEHSSGDIIVLSGKITSTTYQLVQVHLN